MEGKGKHLRVLLAEDVETNAEIIQALLRSMGIRADHALDGQTALNLFSARRAGYYDAVITDIQMPKLDGLQLSRAIRALNRADGKTVPIIALSADAGEEDARRSREAGINAHLAKPVEAETLDETLRALISP